MKKGSEEKMNKLRGKRIKGELSGRGTDGEGRKAERGASLFLILRKGEEME